MSTAHVTQEASKLLDQLKDIHIPEPSGGWTHSINTWWISVAGILAVIIIGVLARRYYMRTRTRRYALAELEAMQARFNEHGEHQRLLNELNMLLRRMAMINYDREKISPLAGRNWLTFLDRSGQTQEFSQGIGQVLIQAYQPSPEAFDENALIEVVRQWIKRQL
ncbi:DUF4381 domain-containing protein [Oceanospirillum linum]|uniref:DUF4381 domain-containing protein n=1 Tax=Oceanospirillum linum TaxID=966 RepID=A0A1T1HA03_OCELI|nr:DUF4381 domain-containing protein [Oceanospirillum linum]OOV86662.1 hypothetical protein BTA35_0212310 [Oceanospirillum linum]SEG26908.1 protein of unknown function [Oleiphilus messinensis]SMP27552.1 protein of unknown function [Oceanospirillum linum]